MEVSKFNAYSQHPPRIAAVEHNPKAKLGFNYKILDSDTLFLMFYVRVPINSYESLRVEHSCIVNMDTVLVTTELLAEISSDLIRATFNEAQLNINLVNGIDRKVLTAYFSSRN